MLIKEWMSRTVLTIDDNESLSDALRLFQIDTPMQVAG